MWYLIVIFISASINLSLIKIFPQVLADYNAIFNNVTHNKKRKISSASITSSQQSVCETNPNTNECITLRQRFLFTLACKDFYERLSNEQKRSFRDIFSNLKEPEIFEMLYAL